MPRERAIRALEFWLGAGALDLLGRTVHAAWVEWARTQPDPKASWLQPWEELGEPDRDADRLIGLRVAELVSARLFVIFGNGVLAEMPKVEDEASESEKTE